ncbi:zf-HC2 domain-containing protein [Streptomyces avicenniae]|uniref:zf-HC2 domain-containing protein n=1 Tax=Streptomyces avicenniae TaxID=500153 RepID=UPI000699DCA4|nr:zf-HC2 domain-containing protein [Streptomyces avicenniae]
MPCIRYRTAISARTEGDLSPRDVTDQELDLHLATCEDCRRWSKRVRALRQATDDLLRRRRSGAPSKPV